MSRLPDRDDVERAIVEAETGTSARIHVALIDDTRLDDPLRRASEMYRRFGRAGAAGVLLLVAPRARRFAVYGDDAVHQRAGDSLWQAIGDHLQTAFARDDLEGGILRGVELLGESLRRYHPAETPQ